MVATLEPLPSDCNSSALWGGDESTGDAGGDAGGFGDAGRCGGAGCCGDAGVSDAAR